MAKYSRRQTVEEKKNMRKAFIYIVLSALFLILLFFFGITAIAKFAGFIADFKGSSEIIGIEDTTPPAPPVFEDIPEYTNEFSLNIKGRAEEGSTLVAFLNNESEEVVVGNNGNFNLSFDLLDGENTISAITKDSAGNESAKSNEYKIIFDNESPELTVSSPENGTEYFGANQRQISIVGSTENNAEVKINGRVVIVNQEGAFSYTVTLADGENKFEIVAIDKAGNETKSELTVSFST